MSLNPQTQGNTLLDVLEGTVTSEFARQENSLLANELVNGQKRMVTSSSYASNTPVKSPGFTRVCFSTNGATIADLANCFINAKLHYTLKFSKAIKKPSKEGNQLIFIGFKQSLDALSRYDIYANAQKIYSQPFVGPESFIMDAGINNLMRKTQPYVYTSWSNVYKHNNNVCGTYIWLTDEIAEGKPFTIEIQVKIFLHQILLLSGIRYLPSFAGRWELEMYFNSTNLVIAQVDPSMSYTEICFKANRIPQGFVQINEPFNMCTDFRLKTKEELSKDPTPDYICEVVKDQKLTCDDCIANEVYMNISQFQLRYEVFEGLRQHYAERPWIIPTNVLQYSRFSGHPTSWEGDSYHATLSQSLENCDSVFILIPQTTNQQTCFYNPYLDNVRMSLGEFGIHPSRYVDTHDDPRFLNMVLDALNLSESSISAMNDDVARSLMGSRQHYMLEDGKFTTCRQSDFGDKSHFFIGISLSPNGFQNGCVNSPNTSIPFLFDANFNNELVREYWSTSFDEDNNKYLYPSIDSSIICLFLIDMAIMIQVVPGSDIPSVKITSKSIV